MPLGSCQIAKRQPKAGVPGSEVFFRSSWTA